MAALQPVSPEVRAQAQATRAARLAEWSQLDLRQDWADESFMRDNIAKAGLTSPVSTEPATVPRLRQLLRRAGIHGAETHAALGCSLEQYLEFNPRYPLWVALAFIIEMVRS